MLYLFLLRGKQNKNIWQKNSIGQELALLHCISSYPAPLESANLLVIRELEQFGDVIGYSDHTLGVEAVVTSVAVGARVIEKHFTIDKKLPGPDHIMSLNPEGLRKTIKFIREISKMIYLFSTNHIFYIRNQINKLIDIIKYIGLLK